MSVRGHIVRTAAAMASLGSLWWIARGLDRLGPTAAILAVAAIAAAIALIHAYPAAVRRGHRLALFRAGGWVHGWLSGWALALALRFALATVPAAALLLGLGQAGWPDAAGLAVGAALFPVLLRRAARLATTEAAPDYAAALAQVWAQWLTLAAALLAYVATAVLTAALAPPAAIPATPEAQSALLQEVLTAVHLWSGFEALVFGHIATLGTWGYGAALVLTVLGKAAFYFGAVALIAVWFLPPGAAARVIAPAHWQAAAPPGPRALTALGLAAGAVALAVWGAGQAERWLQAQAPETRPVERQLTRVERIGERYFAAGTADRLATLDRDRRAAHAGANQDIAVAVSAGFDGMSDNVDGFLDWYYSLPAEYGRLTSLLAGNLEAHLEAKLAEHLNAGDPFAGVEAAFAAAIARVDRAETAFQSARARVLAEAAITPAPYLTRVLPLTEAAAPAAPPSLSWSADYDRFRTRAGWSAAAGSVAGVVTARIAARGGLRLAASGLGRIAAARTASAGTGAAIGGWLGGAAGSVVPGLGTAAGAAGGAMLGGMVVALGTDRLLLLLEETLQRDAFRTAILADLKAAETRALHALTAQD